MRIGWASPWNADSAIATFGACVTKELVAVGHEVEIIRLETGLDAERPARDFSGTIRFAQDLTLDELLSFDAVIVNFGNYYPFHGAALPMLRLMPATVAIMHDVWMNDFVEGWRVAAGSTAFAVDAWFGEFEPDDSRLSGLCPLAHATVVHAEHYAGAARHATPGPVATIPLASDFSRVPAWSPTPGRLILSTIGHANPNKRIREVLRAIGSSARLRESVVYRVIGSIAPDEKAALTALAEDCGIAPPVFTGHVSDETLTELRSTTDVFCCLRYPLTEGASASLLLAMSSGRPCIVSDHGVYGEMPDDVVMKCPAGNEAAHVAGYLERILDEPARAMEMATHASAYVLRQNSPRAYATELLAFLDRVLPLAAAGCAARAMGATLAGLGMRRGDPALARWSKQLVGRRA